MTFHKNIDKKLFNDEGNSKSFDNDASPGDLLPDLTFYHPSKADQKTKETKEAVQKYANKQQNHLSSNKDCLYKLEDPNSSYKPTTYFVPHYSTNKAYKPNQQ